MKKSIKTLLAAIVVTSASCIFNPLNADAYAKKNSYLPQPESGWTRYDDASPYIKYDGYGWNDIDYFEYYKGSQTRTCDVGDDVEFKFKGSKFRIIAETESVQTPAHPDFNIMEVYVDGIRVDAFNEVRKSHHENCRQNLVYEYDTNKNATHEVRLVKCKDIYEFRLDAIDVTGSMTFDDATSNPSSTKKESRAFIDSMTVDGKVFNNSLRVGGWALDDSGINHINIYLDDTFIGKTYTNIKRPDVDKAFPGYKNGLTSGFDFSYDISNYQTGNHKIKLEVIANDGSKQIQERTFKIERKSPKLTIDAKNNQVVDNNLYLFGWSLNDSGVNSVKIYIDNQYFSSAAINGKRPDVNKAYPGYKDGENSGYGSNLDISSLPTGNHTAKIISTGNDGTTCSSSINFSIKRKQPITMIDSPRNNETKDSDTMSVFGWALNDSGIKTVKFYIDNKEISQSNLHGFALGNKRPDVDKAFPGYKNGINSGFSAIVDMKSYSKGNHIIKVEAIGYDGSFNSTERYFKTK